MAVDGGSRACESINMISLRKNMGLL